MAFRRGKKEEGEVEVDKVDEVEMKKIDPVEITHIIFVFSLELFSSASLFLAADFVSLIESRDEPDPQSTIAPDLRRAECFSTEESVAGANGDGDEIAEHQQFCVPLLPRPCPPCSLSHSLDRYQVSLILILISK